MVKLVFDTAHRRGDTIPAVISVHVATLHISPCQYFSVNGMVLFCR
jgi:hypothetical protein